MGPFDSPPMGFISSPLIHMVYLVPFVSYLAGSKSVPSVRPSDPDTMTHTAQEAIASSSDKRAQTVRQWKMAMKKWTTFVSERKNSDITRKTTIDEKSVSV